MAVLLAAVVLPPVGLLLVWMRAGMSVVVKLLASVGIAVIGVLHLFFVWGLQVELDGTGTRPIFSFGTPEAHYADLERDRQQDQPLAPPRAAPAPAPVASAEPAVDVRVPARETPARGEDRGYWTDFRGPNRDGRYDEMPILTSWPEDGLKELWRKPIGGGYASFVVAGGKAFTIEQRRDEEVVAAYDFETGRELWTNSWNAHFSESMGGPGPRATPTWHEGRLYALGAEGEFRCFEADTGELIWRKNILADNGADNLQWAMAASPLVIDDKVIVLPGGRNGRSVVAYHKLTGEPVWASLSDKQAYTAPMVATLAGRRQLVIVSAGRVMGLTVEEGELLWEHPWSTSYDINAAQPLVVDGDRLYISAGYGHGAELLQIANNDGSFSARRLWQTNRMKNKFNGAVLHDGHIYGLDEGILACIALETGELKWKGGRYGYGQVLLAGGHLIVISERGELALVKATSEGHQELARFQAIEGKAWNNPAIAGGRLLVRNTREMACYRIASSAP
jgi:outer membrane protein assembly factor BamB